MNRMMIMLRYSWLEIWFFFKIFSLRSYIIRNILITYDATKNFYEIMIHPFQNLDYKRKHTKVRNMIDKKRY